MKNCVKAALVFLCLAFIKPAFPQAFVEGTSFGGLGSDYVGGIEKDTDGNLYIVGISENPIFNGDTVTNPANGLYLAKLTPAFDLLWAKNIGYSNNPALPISAAHVNVGNGGEVYVSGGWHSYGATDDSIHIGDTAVVQPGNNWSAGIVFLAKFDTAGNFSWARFEGLDGLQSNSTNIAVECDGSGGAYMLSAFSGTYSIDTFTLQTSGLHTDWALTKYSPSGQLQWYQQIETGSFGAISQYGSLATDPGGNIYISAAFSDTLTIDTSTVPSPNIFDIYVAKLTASGDVVWLKAGGGPSVDIATGIAVDSNSNVFVSMYSGGSVSFGSQTFATSSEQAVVVMMDGGGNAYNIIGSNGHPSFPEGIEIDHNGHLYIAGRKSPGTLQFGTHLIHSISNDLWIAKFDYINNEWIFAINPASSTDDEQIYDLVVLNPNELVAVGTFMGVADFGGFSLSQIMDYDGLLLKIGNCEHLQADASIAGGNNVLCTGGSVTIESDTSSLYSYQWLYNGAALPGEINESFMANSSGNYSVAIDSVGCKDTSNILNVQINALPTVSHSIFPIVCDADGPVALAGGSPIGGVYSGPGVTSGIFDPAQAAFGNNIITYTYTDSNGCADSINKVLTVSPSPYITNTVIEACVSDGPINLAVSVYGLPIGGTHSGTGVIGTQFHPSVAGPGTHVIYYTRNGCVSPDSIIASVSSGPAVSIPPLSNACGSSGIPVPLFSGSPAGGTYSGTGVFGGSLFYPNVAGPGIHDIIYTVADSGCSTSDTTTITVDPAPTATLATLPDLCTNSDTLNLANFAVPVGGVFSGSGITGNVFDPAIAGNGTFAITYSHTNACGTASDSRSMSVNPPPLVSILSSTHVTCSGGSNGLSTATATGGSGSISYTWSNGDNSATATGLAAGIYTVTATDAIGCQSTDIANITEPAPVSVSITSYNHPTCNGDSNGSATASATGGMGTISYAWPNGDTVATAFGLVAGNYTVTATDSLGCTGTQTAVISEPGVVTVSIAATDISCINNVDGSAIASATGGTGSFSFSWNNGGTAETISGLLAGTYVVTATDANGCTGTNNTEINEPDGVTTSISSVSPVSCLGGNDGSATASATGGTGSFIYIWSNGDSTITATGLTAGNYTVTAIDSNGCQDTANISISEPATALSVSIALVANLDCNGGTNGMATAAASGGTGSISYTWSNGNNGTTATGLAAETYTVTATDLSGCQAVDTVAISEPAAVSLSIASLNDVSCYGAANGSATASATGGTGSISYAWPNGDTTTAITGLPAGSYVVTASDSLGCTDTDTAVISAPGPVLVSITSTDISCLNHMDGLATASANGGTGPFSFSWNNGDNGDTISGLSAGMYYVTATDANGCTGSDSVTIMEPSAVTASIISVTSVTCFGGNNGAATASATGGNGSIFYAWSNGDSGMATTGLFAGGYTVTATDINGCHDTANVWVSQPASAVTVSITSFTDVSCNGGNNGSATASATGGTGSISYTWPNGDTTTTINGLQTGSYVLTATDAMGCTSMDTAVISEPAVLSASATSGDVSCHGGSNGLATASASGGTGPYTYSWSNGENTGSVTGLSAGSYEVTVTDVNACTAMATAIIGEPASGVSVSITTATAPSCNGGADGSATASSTGGTGTIFYAWSNGENTATISGLSIGTYTVTATDVNGCTASDTSDISGPPALTVAVVLNNAVSCKGGSDGAATASSIGGTGVVSFEWPGGADSPTAVGLPGGTYIVTATDANGCTAVGDIVVPEPAAEVGIAFTDSTDIMCAGESTGQLTTLATGGTGTLVYTWSTGGNGNSVAGLPSGEYCVTATDANGCSASVCHTLSDLHPLPIVELGNNQEACAGEEIMLSPGGGFLSYSWSTGASGAFIQVTATDTFSVIVTDINGCSNSDSIHISFNTSPTPSLGNDTIVCTNRDSNATLVLDAGEGNAFLWSTGETSPTINVIENGTYGVTVSSANGCEGTDAILAIFDDCENINAVETATAKPLLRLYPNPTTNLLFIEAGVSINGTVIVTNLQGQVLIRKHLELVRGTKSPLNLSFLAQGAYTVSVHGKDFVFHERIVVQ